MNTRHGPVIDGEEAESSSGVYQIPAIFVGIGFAILVVVLASILSTVINHFRELPKNPVATRFENLGEVVIKEVDGPRVIVAIFTPDGREIGSLGKICGNDITYRHSIVDDGYVINQAVSRFDIHFMPSVSMKVGERATLWKQVVVYEIPDIHWLEGIKGYFIGPVDNGPTIVSEE